MEESEPMTKRKPQRKTRTAPASAAVKKPAKRKLSNLNYVTKEQAGFTAMIIGL